MRPLLAPALLVRLFGAHGLGETVLHWCLSHGVRIVLIITTAFLLSKGAIRLLTRLEQRLRTEDAEAGRGPQRPKTLPRVTRGAGRTTAWTIAGMRRRRGL